MDQGEIAKQIKKFKARQIKTRLAYYSTFITLFLSLSSFGKGITTGSLISFILLLPLPIYFLLQSIKLFNKNNYLKIQSKRLLSAIEDQRSRFSVAMFITQPNFAFRISLILFFLVFATAFARARTPEPTLSLNSSTSETNR